jgi:hypothetical protein
VARKSLLQLSILTYEAEAPVLSAPRAEDWAAPVLENPGLRAAAYLGALDTISLIPMIPNPPYTGVPWI